MSTRPFIICIVDDDAVYQFITRKTLEKNNLAKKILIFSDGEEAINFMIDNVANATNLPDIIFLDINMPIMDGFQFMEEYVALKPSIGKKITVYMVTSSVDPVDINRAKNISDISDYIVKPINAEQFEAIINTLDIEGKL